MKSRLKNHLFLVLAFFAGIFLASILGGMILATLFYSIFGAEKDGGCGGMVTRAVSRILTFVIAYGIIYWKKNRDRQEYRRFKEEVKDIEYTAKWDFDRLLRNKDIWGEIVFAALVTLIYWLFNMGAPWLLLNIPLFATFNFGATLLIHKAWMKLKN